MIDENKIVFEESKFGILVNCETHTHVKMIIKCPLIIAKFIILKLFPSFIHVVQKKTSISFILLVMVFFAQFWGVTHHQFWLRRRRRQGHLFR